MLSLLLESVGSLYILDHLFLLDLLVKHSLQGFSALWVIHLYLRNYLSQRSTSNLLKRWLRLERTVQLLISLNGLDFILRYRS